jgi:hypothetical protein
MPQRAQVTSVEALEAFRATLIVYLSKARPTLEEVSADVLRTRLWLENEQRNYWENQARRRHKELEQAQAALFSARLSNLRKETAAEVMAVHRARRSLDEAQTKLLVLKRWLREFDAQAQPLLKQMEKLHTVLANDMVKAVAYLSQTVTTLDDYASITPPPSFAAASVVTGKTEPIAAEHTPEKSDVTGGLE